MTKAKYVRAKIGTYIRWDYYVSLAAWWYITNSLAQFNLCIFLSYILYCICMNWASSFALLCCFHARNIQLDCNVHGDIIIKYTFYSYTFSYWYFLAMLPNLVYSYDDNQSMGREYVLFCRKVVMDNIWFLNNNSIYQF
jgi:hypothetical protein